MGNKKYVSVLAGVLCLLSLNAQAETITVESEQEICKVEEYVTAPETHDVTTKLWFNAGACLGGMQTFLEILVPANHGRHSTIKGICAPLTLSAGQGIKVFLKWAQDNPDKAGYLYSDGFYGGV